VCGIVGFIDRSNTTQKEQIVKNMMDTIVHRGPNSAGQFIDEGAALFGPR
jgi:asparagine synthase (glutamine-hydrolysing)